MKLIFKIARVELRNLFYSPIAWFLTIAFLIECALKYTSLLGSYTRLQELGGANLAYLTFLTNKIFGSSFGLFSDIVQKLYLYIPLLTMGLISREINGGTISLLYSSPVKIREIVFGKFLAMMIYSLVLSAVIGIFLFSGAMNIKSADIPMLLSALLGVYLLLCAYSAIGLFMSCLTSYQVVAALSTFVTIGALSFVGGLWQGIDFVRDLTYFLAINGRTSHMLVGLITSKDVIYFLVIVYIFVGLTIYKLKASRESKPLVVKISRYAFIVVTALTIGYLSSRPAVIVYWDTTRGSTNTLTPNAQQIIKEFGKEPLEVTAYSNFLDNYFRFGMPEDRNNYLARWENYVRFKTDINFHFVNYYDSAGMDMFRYNKGQTLEQIAKGRAKSWKQKMSMFKTPRQIHKMIDLKPEMNRFVMQLKYKGRTTYLRVFNDMMVWPSETEVSAAFKRLLQDKMPEIAFVIDNGERSTKKRGEREYEVLTQEKTFRYALINQGFDVSTLSLDKENIPESITALVIADPQSAFSPVALQKIKDYIAKGGNLLISGEPGRQQFLNPILTNLGVQMQDGMLEQKSEDFAPMLLQPTLTKMAYSFSKALQASDRPISVNGAAALSYSDIAGFHVSPLMVVDKAQNTLARNPDLDIVGSESQMEEVSQDTQVGESQPQNMTKKVKKGDFSTIKKNDPLKAYTTAVALTRKVNGREQRIVVSGDADFMSNGELGRSNIRTSNFLFSTAIFSWMDNGQFPIDTSRPESLDNRVKVTTESIDVLKIIYIWIIPALLLVFGSVLLIRRKRK